MSLTRLSMTKVINVNYYTYLLQLLQDIQPDPGQSRVIGQGRRVDVASSLQKDWEDPCHIILPMLDGSSQWWLMA